MVNVETGKVMLRFFEEKKLIAELESKIDGAFVALSALSDYYAAAKGSDEAFGWSDENRRNLEVYIDEFEREIAEPNALKEWLREYDLAKLRFLSSKESLAKMGYPTE
ncbi:MAG: hypothetical protein OXG05_10630 [Gammaproteobacteria bacterium]|nr:hypothetical protein [Gammaproteobacteria bacterium]